jgi:hypothetical protein
MRLNLGVVVATPGALEHLADGEATRLFIRHMSGDWGEVDDEDRATNDWMAENGGRVLSAYHTADGTKVWIITEADRHATTILLPDEY